MPAEPGKTKIGFIGLGIMGGPMSRNLVNAGYELKVFNRSDRTIVKEVVKLGATRVSSPKEAAEGSDITITIVTDTPDVQEVILGENGAIEGAQSGSVVIDMSTISPKATQEMAEGLLEKGVNMLDAPVSGGDKGAIEGTLSIMLGGAEDVFNECLPVLEVMGGKITLIGDNGAGQMTKLCNQIAVSVTNLATAEALMLGAKAGLNLDNMLAAISGGAAGSWQMTNLAPRVLKGDFDPGFMVKLQQKDLKLVIEAANELGLSLPGVSLAHQAFNIVEGAGFAADGTQALIKAYERQAGVEARS